MSALVSFVGGDGVGPKVVDAAQRVITALDPRREIFRQASFPQLNTEAVVRAGNVDAVLTRDVIRQIRESAAVLFGSLGMPHLAKELQMILGKKLIIELFRQGFENNVNCRPNSVFGECQITRYAPTQHAINLHVFEAVGIEETYSVGDKSGRSVNVTQTLDWKRYHDFAETIAHSIANSGGQIALGHKANVLEYLHGGIAITAQRLTEKYRQIGFSKPLYDSFLAQLMRDPSQIEQHVVLDRVFAEILKPTLEVLNSGVTPGEIREGWQLVVMRENSQDLYTFNGHTHLNREATSADALDKTGTQYALHTEDMIARLIDASIAEAIEQGRDELTIVTLRSVYPKVSDLWITVAREKCETYGDFTCKVMEAPDFLKELVLDPTKVQGVFAMPNMLGDLLSDAVTGKNGGMGLAPSHCYLHDPLTNNAPVGPTVSESIGGSAVSPQGVVLKDPNPTATFLALAMLLRHHGQASLASRVENAIRKTFDQGIVTPDLAKPGQSSSTTEQFTATVIKNLE